MSDQPDMTKVRSGIVQFIGAMLQHCGYKGAPARQIIAAVLVEEAIKVTTVNDKVELYSAKPILRAAITVLETRKKEYEDILGITEHRQQVLAVIREIRSAIKLITAIVEGEKGAD